MENVQARDALTRHAVSGGSTEAVLVTERKGPPAFAPICPNCSNPADRSILVQKVFERTIDDGDTTKVVRPVSEYRVPFCSACAQRHTDETKPITIDLYARRLLFSDGTVLGALIVCGIAVAFMMDALRTFRLGPLVFSLLPWTVGGYLLRGVWNQNAYMTVRQPTSVSSAVNFSDDLSAAYEPPWRAFMFRNMHYAALFRQTNSDRLWDPGSEEARVAHQKRLRSDRRVKWVIGTVLATVGLYAFWDEILRPIWPSVQSWFER